MTDEELDQAYTAICRALGEVGEGHAQQFLALLSLALVVRVDHVGVVLDAVDQARQGCGAGN